MIAVSIVEPEQLGASELAEARALVEAAFGESFRTHDWLHALDGVHVLLAEGGELLAHAAVVARTLSHHGERFDTGYVEGVAVRADQQGRGLGSLVMDHAESIIGTRHQIGALNAVQDAATFYASRGWRRWCGHTQGNTPDGIIDTYDAADRIFILPLVSGISLTSTLPLMCDWRIGDLW